MEQNSELSQKLSLKQGAFSKETIQAQGLQPTYQLVPLKQSIIPYINKEQELIKPKPQVLEEDEYFSYIEEIIKRDYFPDLLKLEAYQDYQDRQRAKVGNFSESTARSGRSRQALPSILLRDTPVDPSIFDRRDPLEKFLDKNKPSTTRSKVTHLTSYHDAIEAEVSKRIDVSQMSLDEYVSRYTSEDNSSFQEMNERDREQFLKRISWMFIETDKYNKLNQLALEHGAAAKHKMLVHDDQQKLRTIPRIQMNEHVTQSQLFFHKPGEDLARAHELQVAIREAWADIKGGVGSATSRIAKSNCRFSSEYLVNFLEQDRKHNETEFQHFRNDADFERPMDKNVLNGVFKKPIEKGSKLKEPALDLADLMAKNRGEDYIPPKIQETPIVNGFKMIKATPLHQPASTFKRVEPPSPMITWGKIDGTMFLGMQENIKKYKVPETPKRDELGIQMAN